MLERSLCGTTAEVISRINKALLEGYEYKDMGVRRGQKGMPREIVIAHEEICLHVREAVITTVKPNMAYLARAC
ncbi:MAG TPA: hypothetical protein P5511_07775 [Candidatus Goldiibacteriota bacterium]|nr:hypothetical protein [Candidatus Goldiibacteriota bacterium]